MTTKEKMSSINTKEKEHRPSTSTDQEDARVDTRADTRAVENRAEKSAERRYAILMETKGDESWYYFILNNGNEKALAHLEKQLESVEWEENEKYSMFVLEMRHLVSEQTAKEMTIVDLNATSFHRKFDGVLQTIDFGLKSGDDDEKKMKKIHKMIGLGDIDDFIGEEDEPPSDGSDDEKSDVSSTSSEKEKKPKKSGKLPQAVIDRIKKEQKRK